MIDSVGSMVTAWAPGDQPSGVLARPGAPCDPFNPWMPLQDGRVRQHWEATTDGGKTWTTVFDGYYSRRESMTSTPNPARVAKPAPAQNVGAGP